MGLSAGEPPCMHPACCMYDMPNTFAMHTRNHNRTNKRAQTQIDAMYKDIEAKSEAAKKGAAPAPALA